MAFNNGRWWPRSTSGDDVIDLRWQPPWDVYDNASGGDGNDTIIGNMADNRLRGDNGNDVLVGESGNDDLEGGSGADRLYGGIDNDDLDGGTGNDELHGGAGADVLRGGDGADRLWATDAEGVTFAVDVPSDAGIGARETLDGGTGNDVIFLSHDVNATIIGGDGIDTLVLDADLDSHVFADPSPFENVIDLLTESGETVFGASLVIRGIENVDGDVFRDVLRGDDGDNILQGFGGDDRLEGRGGNDTLDGGSGADTMLGGAGNDSYHVQNSGDVVTENINEGNDTVYSMISYTLGANLESLVLQAGGGSDSGFGNALGNTIIGNESDNLIAGHDGEDLLKGGGGADELRGGNHDDILYGEGGHDTLNGQGGNDEMYGGTGDDTYAVNSAGDIVVELTGEGFDRVYVTSGVNSYTLTANVESLILSGGVNGTGNALNNTISGNILDNVIDGAGGQDTMQGGLGDDTYIVDQVNDIVREAAGEGDDTVLTSVSYTLGAGVEVESLSTTNDNGTAAINLTGNGFENAIRGNDGTNILNGGGGSDALDGRGGVDTANYLGNTGRVVVVLGSNGATGVAYEFATVNNQEILVSTDTLAGIENVRGSIFGDTLVGNEAVNELRGFNGNDIYVVQNAGDVVIELAGQGADEVRTSVSYALSANADVEIFRTTDDAGTAAINLTGNGIDNSIIGNAGNNVIDGAGGADHLFGGRGADILAGGAQGDTFVWSNLDQTGVTVSNMDLIQDFNVAAGDRIDLSQVDANVFADGNQAFTFVGQATFSGTPGEINYVHLNGNTVIQMQTGTSGDIEGGIVIAGIHTPDASWFVL